MTLNINRTQGVDFIMSSKLLKVFLICLAISFTLTLNRILEKKTVIRFQNVTIKTKWCNSCINYHQYKAVIYPKHIPDTYLDMVIFIPSRHGDASFQRRQFLRKFILNSTHFPEVKIRHVFVFGKFSLFLSLASKIAQCYKCYKY